MYNNKLKIKKLQHNYNPDDGIITHIGKNRAKTIVSSSTKKCPGNSISIR
jgi:hypothetical protein